MAYIHYAKHPTLREPNVLCANGSAHAQKTLDKSEVTCPACMAKLKMLSPFDNPEFIRWRRSVPFNYLRNVAVARLSSDGAEEIGSSDISCELLNMFKEWELYKDDYTSEMAFLVDLIAEVSHS
jgi:hypothetical protein